MLCGLIMRGVAFDFRVKARAAHREIWNKVFFAGSLIMALSQGYMLGSYILGFDGGWAAFAFSMLAGVCVAAGYCLIGACWLIMKTEGELQKKSVRWAQIASYATVIGIILISITTPMVSPRIFEKWFVLPQILWLSPLPIISGALFVWLWFLTFRLPAENDRHSLTPFLILATIFACGFGGLAYSFYPFVVPDQITIWQAAAATESLAIILAGTVVVLPVIIGYSFYAYRVFGGKAGELRYD
jgi:cytochrome d ubiquinol oxidase subunit II